MPTIYKHGRSRTVTRRSYERLWKQRGWRLTPQPTSTPTETSVDEPAGESPDVKEG